MSMKKVLTFTFILLFLNATAQLLRNDFEEYQAIPNQLGQWFLVHGLLNPSGGDQGLANPDYFHYGASAEADLPETAYSIISPKNGQGVMGLHVADKTDLPKQEYISFELAQPLEIGKSYHLQFSWSNGKRTAVSPAGLAVSNLGVLLSDQLPHQIGANRITDNAQFVFENSLYSEDWREANITFIATENSKFVTMGVFGDGDVKSLLKSQFSGAQIAYYFFDAVRLWEVNESHVMRVPWLSDGMPIPLNNVIEGREVVYVPNSFTPNEDGKNDVFMEMQEEVLGWNLELYNRWGELIFKSQNARAGWDGKYHGSVMEEDIYYWQLTYLDPEGDAKKCTGNVFLIR